MDEIVQYLYSDGDMQMMCCKLVTYIFALESFAYIISLILGVVKCSKD